MKSIFHWGDGMQNCIDRELEEIKNEFRKTRKELNKMIKHNRIVRISIILVIVIWWISIIIMINKIIGVI